MTPTSPTPDGCAVVTGASSGIGVALATVLAERGHRLLLVARRGALMDDLADRLRAQHGVEVEVRAVDLSDRAARHELLVELGSRPVDVLCNNAGVATFGPLVDLDVDAERAQVELNAVAVHDLTLAVLPGMVSRRHGGILVSGSVAGAMPIPHNATYAATKAFVGSLTESLHHELKPHGVSVTLLAPGPVRTQVPDPAQASKVDRFVPDALWLSSRRAAQESLDALAAGRVRVVPGIVSKVLMGAARWLPSSLTAPAAGRAYARLADPRPAPAPDPQPDPVA